MNKSIRKMENNLLIHTKHETTHFDVLSDKRQTLKVPFARYYDNFFLCNRSKTSASFSSGVPKTEKKGKDDLI